MKIVERVTFIEKIPLSNFTDVQLTFFNEVIQGLKHIRGEKGEMNLDGYSYNEEILEVSDTLLSMKGTNRDANKVSIQNLILSIDLFQTETVRIKLNKGAAQLVKQHFHNIGLQELLVFANLDSKYTRAFFLFLLEAETDEVTVEFDSLKKTLAVPGSYRTIDIDKRVLDVIEKDMSSILARFSMEKIKGGRGNKIQSIRFIWSKEYVENLVNTVPKPAQSEKGINQNELRLIGRLDDL